MTTATITLTGTSLDVSRDRTDAASLDLLAALVELLSLPPTDHQSRTSKRIAETARNNAYEAVVKATGLPKRELTKIVNAGWDAHIERIERVHARSA